MKKQLIESTPNQSIDELRQLFLQEGYLLLKNLFPKTKVEEARILIFEELLRQGWVCEKAGRLFACEPVHRIGSPSFFKCIQSLISLEMLHTFSYHPRLNQLLAGILQTTVYPHPRKMIRLGYPYAMNPLDSTPAHQDVFYVRGEPDTLTVWIPLGAYTYVEGGLEVVPRSHLKGLYPTRANEEGRFNCTAAEGGLDQLEWHGTDYEWGDALIMHALTLHQAVKNKSQEFRISLDTRFSSSLGHLNEEQLLPPYYPHVQAWHVFNQHWKNPHLFDPPATLQIEAATVSLETVMQRPSLIEAYVTH